MPVSTLVNYETIMGQLEKPLLPFLLDEIHMIWLKELMKEPIFEDETMLERWHREHIYSSLKSSIIIRSAFIPEEGFEEDIPF